MRRPLAAFAVLVALFIALLDQTGRLSAFERLPAFRRALEEAGTEFLDGTLEGTLVFAKKRKDSFVLEVKPAGERGKVRVYGTFTAEEVRHMFETEVRLKGRFFLFERQTNFGGRDVRNAMDAEGIYAGFLTESWESVGENPAGRFNEALFAFRLRAEEMLSAADPEAFGFLKAVLLIDFEDLEAEEKHRLSDLGLMPYFSSKGLFFYFAGAAFQFLLKRRIRNRGAVFLLSAAFFGLLGLFFGLSFSFLRAFAVFLIRTGASAFRRKFDPVTAGAAVIPLFLLSTPALLKEPVFWYVLAALYAMGVLRPELRELLHLRSLLSQAAVRILLLQLCFYPAKAWFSFGTFPFSFLLGVLSTALRIVLFLLENLALFLYALFPGAPGVSGVFVTLSGKLSAGYLEALRYLSGNPVLSGISGRPETWKLLLYIGLLLALYAGFRILRAGDKKAKRKDSFLRKRRVVLLAVSGLLAASSFFVLRTDPLSPSDVRLTMADVGQGDGFLLQTGDGVFVSDFGSSDRENVSEILVNTLFYDGLTSIDAVFLSHGDKDHASGLEELLSERRLPVRHLFLPDIRNRETEFRGILEAAEKAGVPVTFLGAGDRLTFGGTTVRILHPRHGSVAEGNEASLVTEVHAGERTFLFPGDLPGKKEESLALSGPVDVLKVAHHGSAYSTLEPFLQKAKPAIALASYGVPNSYGHPSAATVQRLDDCGALFFGSGKDGATRLTFHGDSFRIDSVLSDKHLELK